MGRGGGVLVLTNDNCLAGMACPQCGSEGPFRIEVQVLVTVFDSGTDFDRVGDIDWSDDAYATCAQCDWDGIAEDLHVKNRTQPVVD